MTVMLNKFISISPSPNQVKTGLSLSFYTAIKEQKSKFYAQIFSEELLAGRRVRRLMSYCVSDVVMLMQNAMMIIMRLK